MLREKLKTKSKFMQWRKPLTANITNQCCYKSLPETNYSYINVASIKILNKAKLTVGYLRKSTSWPLFLESKVCSLPSFNSFLDPPLLSVMPYVSSNNNGSKAVSTGVSVSCEHGPKSQLLPQDLKLKGLRFGTREVTPRQTSSLALEMPFIWWIPELYNVLCQIKPAAVCYFPVLMLNLNRSLDSNHTGCISMGRLLRFNSRPCCVLFRPVSEVGEGVVWATNFFGCHITCYMRC